MKLKIEWKQLGEGIFEAQLEYNVAELKKLEDGRWQYGVRGYNRYSHQYDDSAPTANTREEAEAGIVKELLRVNSHMSAFLADNIILTQIHSNLVEV